MPGLLAVQGEVFDNDGTPETVITGLDGRAFVAVAIEIGPNNPGMREANARRLAACWNACHLITTERLEDLGKPLMEHLIGCDERAVRMVAEKRELIEALREAENALADYIPTIERTGASLNYGRKVLQQVRSAIAKAKATSKEGATP